MKGWTRRRFVGALGVAGASWVVTACGQPGTQATIPASTDQVPTSALDGLQAGQGAILTLDGVKVAVYKDTQGNVVRLSPKCPHQGCELGWNAADSIWECPCHGSQFEPDGTLHQGPATTGMERLG
ncbi:MAG: Rieske 2Fe-2S domain-containing protein [Anaerolineae bacterium]